MGRDKGKNNIYQNDVNKMIKMAILTSKLHIFDTFLSFYRYIVKNIDYTYDISTKIKNKKLYDLK